MLFPARPPSSFLSFPFYSSPSSLLSVCHSSSISRALALALALSFSLSNTETEREVLSLSYAHGLAANAERDLSALPLEKETYRRQREKIDVCVRD